MSNECPHVRGPDGVQENVGDLYWFRPRNALCPVGEGSSVLSCTEMLVVGVISGYERGTPKSQGEREENVGVCDSASALARSRRVISSCLAFVLLWWLFFFRSRQSPRMILACSFHSLMEVQGYKILACGVTLAGGGA
jgi:hypothetical protein